MSLKTGKLADKANTVVAVNERLKGYGVSLSQVGEALYLEATLLPKNNGVGAPTQYRIPASSATIEGIEWSEARAFEVKSAKRYGLTISLEPKRYRHRLRPAERDKGKASRPLATMPEILVRLSSIVRHHFSLYFCY